jgi:tRNA(fMet)-specific endonuclease VapC
MRYLLDTNIIAEPTKPQPNQQVLDRLIQLAGDLAISSVTWHELWFGTERLPTGRSKGSVCSIEKRGKPVTHFSLLDVLRLC